jgi:hypothetical protein
MTLKRLWRRKLPTGEALVEEARRRGISEYETWKGGAEGKTTLDEPELQRRVLAARADRRSMILNFCQTLGIIAALVFSLWSLHIARVQKSAELMLAFDDKLSSGGSARVAEALDRNRNLDKTEVTDDELEDFLDKYELLGVAYQYHLIDKGMTYDAFEYELEKALGDRKVRHFLLESRSEGPDIYDRLLEMARSFGIDTSAFAGAAASSSKSPSIQPKPR